MTTTENSLTRLCDWQNVEHRDYETCSALYTLVYNSGKETGAKDWHALCVNYALRNYHLRGSLGMYQSVFAYAIRADSRIALVPRQMGALVYANKRANLLRCRQVLMAMLPNACQSLFQTLPPWLLAMIIDLSLPDDDAKTIDDYPHGSPRFLVFQTLANHAYEVRAPPESIVVRPAQSPLLPLTLLQEAERSWCKQAAVVRRKIDEKNAEDEQQKKQQQKARKVGEDQGDDDDGEDDDEEDDEHEDDGDDGQEEEEQVYE